jgi:hypothetical protein
MRLRLALIITAAVLVSGLGTATLVARAANASGEHEAGHGPGARQFVGYWMGIDPLDGGDSRRGITTNRDGTFSVIGRDTVFTLCDGTDRAIVTVSNASLARSALVSDNLVITCTNTRTAVKLKVRYEAIDTNVIRETVTSQTDQPIDEITFHRVSEE